MEQTTKRIKYLHDLGMTVHGIHEETGSDFNSIAKVIHAYADLGVGDSSSNPSKLTGPELATEAAQILDHYYSDGLAQIFMKNFVHPELVVTKQLLIEDIKTIVANSM